MSEPLIAGERALKADVLPLVRILRKLVDCLGSWLVGCQGGHVYLSAFATTAMVAARVP
ncbi:MAG: hypothetical protein GYA24_08840 [Candidatus Lokiarchaeota archaeon]|nr:hypothetical protein [Candidatus Lokiarchaeota archaeon]